MSERALPASTIVTVWVALPLAGWSLVIGASVTVARLIA
jgi:hypothetical protein